MSHICVPNFAVKSMLHTCACKLTASIYVCGLSWTIFVAFFQKYCTMSVGTQSYLSLTRLASAAFCLGFITGVEVT